MPSTPITELFLHDALRANARNRPALPALCGTSRTYTWLELWEAVCASHLALGERGVVRGSRVASVGLRPEEEIQLGFALSCIGAALVPIPPAATVDEIGRILVDAQPQLVVQPGLPGDGGQAPARATVPSVRFDEIAASRPHGRAESESLTAAALRSWYDPTMVAYPKRAVAVPVGVVSTHRQTILGGFAAAGALGLRRDDCIWLDRPLADTASWAWVTIAAFQQASFVFAPGLRQSAGETLPRQSCTVILTDPGGDPHELTQFDRLRLVVFDRPVTADALEAHAAAWKRKARPAPRFAATLAHPEAGPFALMARPEDVAVSPGCLGTPLPGCYARVGGADGSELPDGETGEVQLRSPFLMDGYYRRPELTASVFRAGWLRTGIEARRDGDGYYHAAAFTPPFASQSNTQPVIA